MEQNPANIEEAAPAPAPLPRRRLYQYDPDHAAMLLGAGLTVAAIVIVGITSWPLGLAGEWVWNRSPMTPTWDRWLVVFGALTAHLAVVLAGHAILSRRRPLWALVLLPLLLLTGAGMQWALVELPAPTLGMERWAFSMTNEATSGYFSHSRHIGPDRTFKDARTFLRQFDEWIANQGSFHIGTHPPGLFLLFHGATELWTALPTPAHALVRHLPERFAIGLEETSRLQQLTVAEQASLASVAGLTWGLLWLTMLVVYRLVRLAADPAAAWAAASVWPIVPAGLLFLPTSDCLFAFLASFSCWLLLAGLRHRLYALAVLAGAVWWLGMTFSLAMVAMLPILFGAVLLWTLFDRRQSIGGSIIATLAFGAGVIVPSEWCWTELRVHLPTIWLTNLRNHAGFYQEMPRSYGTWVWLDLVEWVIVTGPALLVLTGRRLLQRPVWQRSLAVMLLIAVWLTTVLTLDLSGRNLSEVARLWIFLTPFACLSVGLTSFDQPIGRLTLVGLIFLQTLLAGILLGHIEPLLPIQVPMS